MDTQELLSAISDVISRGDSIQRNHAWMSDALVALRKTDDSRWAALVQQHDDIRKTVDSHLKEILIQAAQQLGQSAERSEG